MRRIGSIRNRFTPVDTAWLRMELPDNGMSQAEVRARFGEPEQVHGAVGEPPITRWDYDRWSVYFEHQLVLFTVLHKGAVLDKNEEGGG